VAQFESALREIVRSSANWQQGTLAVFQTAEPSLWVAGGLLGERIDLVEGTYDIMIRSAGRTYNWDEIEVDGEFESRAGRRPRRR
jgi:hypothetical protein